MADASTPPPVDEILPTRPWHHGFSRFPTHQRRLRASNIMATWTRPWRRRASASAVRSKPRAAIASPLLGPPSRARRRPSHHWRPRLTLPKARGGLHDPGSGAEDANIKIPSSASRPAGEDEAHHRDRTGFDRSALPRRIFRFTRGARAELRRADARPAGVQRPQAPLYHHADRCAMIARFLSCARAASVRLRRDQAGAALEGSPPPAASSAGRVAPPSSARSPLRRGQIRHPYLPAPPRQFPNEYAILRNRQAPIPQAWRLSFDDLFLLPLTNESHPMLLSPRAGHVSRACHEHSSSFTSSRRWLVAADTPLIWCWRISAAISTAPRQRRFATLSYRYAITIGPSGPSSTHLQGRGQRVPSISRGSARLVARISTPGMWVPSVCFGPASWCSRAGASAGETYAGPLSRRARAIRRISWARPHWPYVGPMVRRPFLSRLAGIPWCSQSAWPESDVSRC